MTTKGNQKKTNQLGMPHGTACARLRKAILFNLLKKHSENICYKCGKVIEVVEELSVEHKQPWEDVDVALFWDMENIAFSHNACNKPHRKGGCSLRKIGPEGTAWCHSCQQFKDRSLFFKSRRRWNGVSDQCKSCKAVYRSYKKRKS